MDSFFIKSSLKYIFLLFIYGIINNCKGEMKMSTIRFENVDFGYQDQSPLLKDFNLTIKKGKYTVLLGHNGSGKSTIAKLAIGLLEAQKGSIYVDDLLLNEENLSAIRSKIAIVFQNPDNQFIGATVRDDIAFGLENKCVDPNDMDAIIEEYAKKVNMFEFLESEPTNLSGGQKQRVAIAGVLAMQPEFLILDEATSMLDPTGKKEIFDVIHQLKEKNKNVSILSITHHIEEALFADEIVVINNGKVIKIGTPQEILFDKEFLSMNSLEAPFIIELAEALNKAGIKVPYSMNMEELVKYL